jgi:hypothetical protein
MPVVMKQDVNHDWITGESDLMNVVKIHEEKKVSDDLITDWMLAEKSQDAKKNEEKLVMRIEKMLDVNQHELTIAVMKQDVKVND